MSSLFKNIFALQCPRCRRGKLFTHQTSLLNWAKALHMHDKCSSCGLKFELENGFWWGTGYVNYGLTVLFSAVFFILWWLILGFNIHDYSLYVWLCVNGVLMLLMQPWIMRLGRSLYIHLFVSYQQHNL